MSREARRAMMPGGLFCCADMPNPKTLKVGDLVRFISLPKEWSQPGYRLMPESLAFMKRMVRRKWPSRIYEIDEHGPWIQARIRERGKARLHLWLIMESTGWRRVERRR